MENNLKYETSPYLLQHKNNPVNWYPWGNDAFEEAKRKDKPIFLSIGYSTCHWCHVMAHESFEDIKTAELLNENFISIKVDREERPDIDSIYMNVCQAMTGGGGWPLSIFMTPEQKPFFAGTYFPKDAFQSLLKQISILWQTERGKITESGEAAEKMLNLVVNDGEEKSVKSEELINKAFIQLANSFDKKYGGFGSAPKFPMPHNLIFLMDYYKNSGNEAALEMAEKTLIQMYKGGIFDHIGGGFSRYSTDRYFLVPHFEKMLYDNALLILSYIKAYTITNKEVYKSVAEKTAEYVIREMTDKRGGFYSAQDADSDGEEGKYYTFDFEEIIKLLGEKDGGEFNSYYGITERGNFEGKNILNLLNNSNPESKFDEYIPKLYKYRKSRTSIHLDDKILTSWNGLMIAAFSELYKVIGDKKYLDAAENASDFIEKNMSDGDILHVSYRGGRRGVNGFLDDYAFYIYGLINLYEASFEEKYLKRAKALLKKAIRDFFDEENGGFYLCGRENERLIAKPKELYDGAIPSGNSVMAYNMVWLSLITGEEVCSDIMEKHFKFISSKIQDYPAGYCFFLSALSAYLDPPAHIVCAMKDKHSEFPVDAAVFVIKGGNVEYPVLNDRTTYYVCKNRSCLPPVNNLSIIMAERQ